MRTAWRGGATLSDRLGPPHGVPFRYQTALPAESDPHPYRLRWNSATLIRPFKEQFVIIQSRTGDLLMDLKTFHRVASPEFRSIASLLNDLAETVPHLEGLSAREFVRGTIDSLIQRGMLQLEPLGAAVCKRAIRRGEKWATCSP